MSSHDSFQRVFDGLREGNEEAATRVFERFAGRLIGLARQRLDQRFRRKLDPEDVMQSVFKSFFRRGTDGEFTLESWDGLWALLVVLTLRKCGHKARHLKAARRDTRREEFDPSADVQALAREPTAAEAAELTEIIEALMRGTTEREQKILSLRLQDYTLGEISAQVGRTERTVQRILKQFRSRLDGLVE